ncbi:hypothetical protein JVU11DRAFT_10377 [Chiua virens]|nr:hypothetical protein JVU11DRAFT_10377 [Chiua virens]
MLTHTVLKIKSKHTLIGQIRSASGFHYDDVRGATVDDNTRPAWEGFCKASRAFDFKLFFFHPIYFFQSHPGAARYKKNPWPYWNDVTPLMSAIPKKMHVHRPAATKSKRHGKQPGPSTDTTSHSLASESHHAPNQSMSSVTMNQLAKMAVHDVDPNPTAPTSSMFSDPNSIPPSTPSSEYLSSRPPAGPQSTVSMASTSMMMSISQRQMVGSVAGSHSGSERKRKADSVIGSQAGGTTSSVKRSRPMSATAQAQTAGAEALQKLSMFFDNVNPAILQPVSLASLGLPQMLPHPLPPTTIAPTQTSDNDYIEHAAEALMTFKLSPVENNDLANYMSDPQNKTRVKFFLKFDAPSRELWIKNTLAEIQAKKDYNTVTERANM